MASVTDTITDTLGGVVEATGSGIQSGLKNYLSERGKVEGAEDRPETDSQEKSPTPAAGDQKAAQQQQAYMEEMLTTYGPWAALILGGLGIAMAVRSL